MNKRLIILAAGQGFKLDGFVKLLIKHPISGETIMDRYLRLFADYDITVVVGYKAVEIMSQYPGLDYVYNDQWRITGNSYGLYQALDERPCVVISSDLLFDEDMVQLIELSPTDSVFVVNSENKGVNTVRCRTTDGKIEKFYMGEAEQDDPESIGIFKITNPQVLKEWKRQCLDNKNVFAGLNLPLDYGLKAVDKGAIGYYEINTPLDYINCIKCMKK